MNKQKLILKLQNKIAQNRNSMKLYGELHRKHIMYNDRIKTILSIIELIKKLPNEPKTVSNNEQNLKLCCNCKHTKKQAQSYPCRVCVNFSSWDAK